jgi:very-short-patch-repair endonuclease
VEKSIKMSLMMNDELQKNRRRSLRRHMTAAERTLWGKLRSRRLENHKFQRQTSIDQYIVDFYCAEKKLVLEIDGDVHGFNRQRRLDQKRQQYLESLGFTILRFTNEEIKNSIEGVLRSILERLKQTS